MGHFYIRKGSNPIFHACFLCRNVCPIAGKSSTIIFSGREHLCSPEEVIGAQYFLFLSEKQHQIFSGSVAIAKIRRLAVIPIGWFGREVISKRRYVQDKGLSSIKKLCQKKENPSTCPFVFKRYCKPEEKEDQAAMFHNACGSIGGPWWLVK